MAIISTHIPPATLAAISTAPYVCCHGHKVSGDLLRIDYRGFRQCQICWRDSQRRYRDPRRKYESVEPDTWKVPAGKVPTKTTHIARAFVDRIVMRVMLYESGEAEAVDLREMVHNGSTPITVARNAIRRRGLERKVYPVFQGGVLFLVRR